MSRLRKAREKRVIAFETIPFEAIKKPPCFTILKVKSTIQLRCQEQTRPDFLSLDRKSSLISRVSQIY